MNEQLPAPAMHTWRAVAASVVTASRLLAGRRTHLVGDRVGTRIAFGDGTAATVYRETVVDLDGVEDPAVLVVTFRLRRVDSPAAHAAFRAESLLNTPLFVGFPGFVSKLWLTHDTSGAYRGLYQWDGAARAGDYARCLWRVLALVSVPGSIRYLVLPGTERDALLAGAAPAPPDPARWWEPTSVVAPAGARSGSRPQRRAVKPVAADRDLVPARPA